MCAASPMAQSASTPVRSIIPGKPSAGCRRQAWISGSMLRGPRVCRDRSAQRRTGDQVAPGPAPQSIQSPTRAGIGPPPPVRERRPHTGGWTRSDTTRCGWCHPGRSPPSPVLPLASAPWVKRRYAVGRAGRNLEATPAMGSRTRPRGARSGGVPPSGPADQVAEIRRLAAVAPRDRRSTIPSRVPRGPPARRRSSGSSYRNA